MGVLPGNWSALNTAPTEPTRSVSPGVSCRSANGSTDGLSDAPSPNLVVSGPVATSGVCPPSIDSSSGSSATPG